MTEHIGNQAYERGEGSTYRNGEKYQNTQSKYGEFTINVPQDGESSFEPQIVAKRQKGISDIEDKTIAMYVKGMSVRQISE